MRGLAFKVKHLHRYLKFEVLMKCPGAQKTIVLELRRKGKRPFLHSQTLVLILNELDTKFIYKPEGHNVGILGQGQQKKAFFRPH